MKASPVLGVACVLLFSTTQRVFSQANRSLSNLTAPTAVNQSLVPGVNNSINLGSTSKKWKSLFLADKAGIHIIPQYSLDVFNDTYSHGIHVNNDFSSHSDNVGVYAESVIADGYGYGVQAYGGFRGVYGEADGGAYTGSGYGVQGQAFGTAGNRYGVYGFASGGSFTAAGYFAGDVWAVSYNYISDRKFKTNIASVQNPLYKLMQLKPAVYEFKTSEYSNMGLPKGKQIGLIADEVKIVFPELVKEAVHPAEYGKDKTVLLHPEVKYEGVNYMGLIPVAIAAIQEHQKTITDLKETINAITAENQELKNRLTVIEQALNISKQSSSLAVTTSEAHLKAAIPNPASKQTAINYYLPQNAGKAAINISDMHGTLIKSISLDVQGKGQITLDATQYAAGIYNYTLIVGGRVIDAKKLILTK